MSIYKTVCLFGSQNARLQAKGVLENCPQIKRIDAQSNPFQMKLYLRQPISDLEILDLLKETALVGIAFRL